MVVGVVARSPIRDNSFLWHVRAGTLQIDSGSVLTKDPFSFNSPDIVWRTQSWVADLAYGWLDRLVGLQFVWPMILLVGGLLLVTLGLCFRRHTSAVFWTAALLTVSSLVLAPYLNPRPALFSLLLFALVVIAAFEQRLWWTLPLLTWIWAGVHGGWPLGILFVLVWAIYARDWRLGQQIVPMSFGALFTAHGWAVLEILIDFVRARESLALITEWAPSNLASVAGFLVVLGLMIALIGRERGPRPTFRVLWLLVPFAYLGFSSTRSLPFLWLALVPLLSQAASALEEPAFLRSDAPGRRAVNALMAVGLLVLPFVLQQSPRLDAEHFPVLAATQLTAERVFHDDTTGGYLIYEYGPKRQVYIDDRAELFGTRVADFIRVRNADAMWSEVFSDLAIEEALLKRKDPLAQVLTEAGWRERFADTNFVLLEAPKE